MNKNLFTRRLYAAIIDHILVLIITYTIFSIVTTNILSDIINQQMAPFISIQLLINPLSLLIQIFYTPQAYGNIASVFILFILSFIVELLYYTLFELLPLKRTPGYILLKLYIHHDKNYLMRTRIVIRNILKIFSRYIYCIPFFILLFNKNTFTIYDQLTRIKIKNHQ